MSDKAFADQTIVVTGGGTGIGRATALAFAELGASTVIITGRRPDRLQEVAALSPAVVPLSADVTTEAGADAVADAVRERGGTLDVLVHNAGVFRFSPLEHLDAATVREVMDINLFGPVLLTGRLLPFLRSPGGSVVLVSSRAGHNATPGASVYAASKSAVHSFTRSWAAELAPKGIRVNSVAPGFVRTEAYVANGLSAEQAEGLFEHVKGDIPLGRVGEAGDVTPWIVRLADPASDLVTGQIITLDGGMDLN